MRPLSLVEYLLLQLASAALKRDTQELYEEYQRQTAKRKRNAEVREVDVEEIYQAYPSHDPINGNRSTGKSVKDKNRIRALILRYGKDYILETIKQELKENERGKWLKNFSTFLNNLPDIGMPTEETPKINYQ